MSEREARAMTKQLRKAAKSSSKSPSRNKSPTRSKSASRNKKSPAEEKATKPKSPARSPARIPAKTKTSTSSKSPSRPKSPARNRSPARNKSPARKKSPARNKSFENKSPPKSPSKENSIGAIKRVSAVRDSPMSRASSQRSTVNYTEPTESEDDSFNERIIRSRVSRFQERMAESVKRASKPINDTSKKADANNIDSTPFLSGHDKAAAVLKTLFAIIISVAIPLIALVTTFSCTKENCKATVKIPWSSWKNYLSLESDLVLLGFVVTQTIISLIPLFKPVTGYPASHKPLTTYQCNGILNWVLTLSGLLAARYFKLPMTSLVVDKLPNLLAPSLGFAFFFALAIFFSSKPDSHTPRSNFIVEFIFGRSSLARIGPLDFKFLLYRICLLSCMSYFVVVAISEMDRKSNYTQFSYSLLLVCFIFILFLSDAFIFEMDSLSTFGVQHEALGLVSVLLFCFFPFLLSPYSNYLYYTKIPDNKYLIAVSIVLFTIGYLLYRIGLHQKASFRRQPMLYANSDVVVSREGRNLLAGGLWGFVRHPNYLGCILIYWSIIPLVYLHWPAYILPVICTIEHIVRVYTVEHHCKQTHTTAWNYYTNKVPYRLLPYIY